MAMNILKKYWKVGAALLVALLMVNMVGSCSRVENREAREMEQSEEHNRRWWESKPEKPEIGDWKTEVFKGNGGNVGR
jgi:hypothetical protein